MRSQMIAACLVLLSVSGCNSMKGAPTNTPPSGAQVTVPAASGSQSTQAPAPVPSPTPAPAPASSPTPPASSVDDSAQKPASSVEHPAPAATSRPVKSATNSTPTKSKSTTGDQPTKEAAGAAPRAPGVPAPPSNKPAAPPTLNLADLEQRLRDTHAIGVFTKLSLKNQVDDLLDEFRTLYKGPNKHPSSELRQRYDLLLLKVLSLLQDSDPTLASAISSSREAIWGILADPDKFAEI